MHRTMDHTAEDATDSAPHHSGDRPPTTDLPPPTRRTVVSAGAATAAAFLSPGVLSGPAAASTAPADLILKTVPGTGERLPAIGLGSFMTFDAPTGHPSRAVLDVVREHWSAGGRVFDCSPLYGSAEAVLGAATASLGISDRIFVTDKVWSTGEHLWDTSHAEAGLRRSLKRLRRRRPIDVVQIHSLVNVDVMVPLLHALKREGRIRQLGVSHHDPAYFPVVAGWVERGDLDFVQVHYSIHTRAAEDSVLRAAADRGVAVLVNMPLEKARLHQAVEGRRLPRFAAEFGIETWSAFFLKWVISHPAVTVALPATSRPEHVAENVAAMRGPLPDPDTRERMVRHMETIPAFHRIGSMPWYPGKSYPGLVSSAQEALRARSPWWA